VNLSAQYYDGADEALPLSAMSLHSSERRPCV